MFTDRIEKINHYDISQERNLVITNKALYNFKKTSLKRRIDFKVIKGVTISTLTDEFVVHCIDAEYDYDFISPRLNFINLILIRRKKIIELLDKSIKAVTNNSLKLSESDQKSLKSFVTLKTEKKKDSTFSRMSNANLIEVIPFIHGDKKKEAIKEKPITALKETLFSRNKDIKDVSLTDFSVLSEIGKGKFGEVALVEYKTTRELFALKSFKKGTLLQFEQVENTLLEKKILQTLDHPFLLSLTFCFQSEDSLYFVMPYLK